MPKKSSAKRTAKAEKYKIATDLIPLARPIGDFVPDPENARHHPERSIVGLRKLLELHGQRKPIVVRKADMMIEAGNGLYTAARELGWTHIAAVIVDDDVRTAKAYGLADNRSAELSMWDPNALSKAMVEVGEFEALGWTNEEAKDIAGDIKLPELVDGVIEPGAGGKAGEERLAATQIRIRIGSYKFDVERSVYDAWVDTIHKSSGFEKSDVLTEIRRRLAL